MSMIIFEGNTLEQVEDFLGFNLELNEAFRREIIKGLNMSYMTSSESANIVYRVLALGERHGVVRASIEGIIEGAKIEFSSVDIKIINFADKSSMSNTDENVPIIVYGTLMEGKHNNYLMHGCEFINEGMIRGTLYHLPYGFPAFVEGDVFDKANCYRCEVYNVPLSSLFYLDRLEGYKANDVANSMYIRRKIGVEINGEIITAYIYEWNRELPKGSLKLKSGSKWNG